MTAELADLLAHFGGETGRTRCFLHVINLVAKMLIRQFDLPKAKGGAESTDKELKELVEDVDLEDLETRLANGEGEDNRDNTDGWVNELEFLTDDERAELEQHLRPLRVILAKVSHTICASRKTRFTVCDSRSASYRTKLSTRARYFCPYGCRLWKT